jgi:alpha-tubulin suppressor-like RCC1 family protein
MGENWFGQLGDGTTQNKSEPVVVMTEGVAKLAAGGDHSLILKNDGSLWASGRNYYGQLGSGNTINRTSPVQITNGVKDIATGADHSLILKNDGSLWAMGDNRYGQLGDGTNFNRTSPVEIKANGVKGIAAGALHSLILMEDGSLWATGFNYYGQLGDGTNIDKSSLTEVILNSDLMGNITDVVAGKLHTLILSENGSLWAMGRNENGQLGNLTLTDQTQPVEILANVEGLAAGEHHSLVLKQDGSLWAAGKNNFRQLGLDPEKTRTSNPPNYDFNEVELENRTPKAVAAGEYHSLVLMQNGSLFGMGYNEAGQLGDVPGYLNTPSKIISDDA